MDALQPPHLSQRILLPRPQILRATEPSENNSGLADISKEPMNWEAAYPYIKRLYQVDKFKLREVMARMKHEHGFKATKHMYKKQFKKWGLVKSRHHTLNSSASVPLTCGKGIQSPQTEFMQIHATIPPVPSMPLSERGLQTVLSCIYNWTFGVGGLPRLQEHSRAATMPAQVYGRPRMVDGIVLHQNLSFASDLLSQNEGYLAGKVVRKVFIELEDVIHDQGLTLMWNLLDAMYGMTMSGQIQLLKAFVRHLASLAQRQLQTRHPIYELCQQMLKQVVPYDAATVAHHLEAARSYNSNLMDRFITSPISANGRELRRSCLARLSSCSRTTFDPFISVIWSFERQFQLLSREHASCINVILSLLPQSRKEQMQDRVYIHKTATEVLDLRWQDEAESYVDKITLDAKRRLARIELQLGKVGLDSGGDITLTGSDDADAAEAYGQDIPTEVREMWFAENLLRLAGRHTEADQVRADSITKAREFVRSVPDFVS